jgi:hypothetical protein
MINFHELFYYCDGELIWKVDRRVKTKGRVAGNRRPDGYVVVKVGGRSILAHRIVWAMFHDGVVPKMIDHIDGNPFNNRLENLRPATPQTNQYNRKMDRRNRHGAKGVYWHARDKTWGTRMQINGRMLRFGTYKDRELAELVMTEARDLYHGEFARHE